MTPTDTNQPRTDTASMADLRTLKKRLSPRLLNIAGVSGVGITQGTLTVYLEVDSDTVRQAVAAVLGAEASNAPVTYVVTGRFRAH
jgi:hypothetical protein